MSRATSSPLVPYVGVFIVTLVAVAFSACWAGIKIANDNRAAREREAACEHYQAMTNELLRWYVQRDLLGWTHDSYMFVQPSKEEVAEQWNRVREDWRKCQ